jgi:hypothetical protein
VYYLIVYSLYIIDWAQTCSATYDGFQWFVYGWGDIAMLYNLQTSYLNVPTFSSIIGAAVQVKSTSGPSEQRANLLVSYAQIFFSWRLFTFSRSYVASTIIVFLAFLQLGGGAAVAWFVSPFITLICTSSEQ